MLVVGGKANNRSTEIYNYGKKAHTWVSAGDYPVDAYLAIGVSIDNSVIVTGISTECIL